MALYRKWRPLTFRRVVGQRAITTTLINALITNNVAHAYLFAGPRGTGKTSTARILAKALNCSDRIAGEPCNSCESCKAFLKSRAGDLIELDAASNRGIDEIRSLRDKVGFVASRFYRVYLIDEAHMLTDAAFNALLKTLEEPPRHVVFILATTEAYKIPPTILSRCQRFDFKRISVEDITATLQRICRREEITAELEALTLIARSATGSLRDAENVLDQLSTYYGKQLTLENTKHGLGFLGDERIGTLADLALDKDLGTGLELLATVRDDGLDLRQFQRELISELADRMNNANMHNVLRALKAFSTANLKENPYSTLPLDLALASICLE